MKNKPDNEKTAKKKTFLGGWFEKMDKKLEEKAKSRPCCCCNQPEKPSDKDEGSCCG